MNEKQITIKERVSVSGVGLHTGVECSMTFVPAEEDFGIKHLKDLILYVYDTSANLFEERTEESFEEADHLKEEYTGTGRVLSIVTS